MRTAAESFIGLHDFRNFCKVDASKQMDNLERRIFHASIDELHPSERPVSYLMDPLLSEYGAGSGNPVEPSGAAGPQVFTFTLHGSAFLWHQVRHMVALLFLIGQGLESPSLIMELLNVTKNPRKPLYEMADDAPLVLWDCIFPSENSETREDALKWVYIGDGTHKDNGMLRNPGNKHGKYGLGGVMEEMWKVWRRRKIDEVLAGSLLDVVASQGTPLDDISSQIVHKDNFRGSQKLWAGGDGARLVGKYVPVLDKPKMDSVEDINARYIKRKDVDKRNVPDANIDNSKDGEVEARG